jgi:cytidylate kinase
MNTNIGLDKCLTFINCQLNPADKPRALSPKGAPKGVVTLSRQAGSGAHTVAERLAEYLQAHDRDAACPWTIFDRNLVEKVLEDHHLPQRLEKFMPEDRISQIADIMDELFGLHPPSETLVQKIAETVLHLAELGKVILVGHGAHVITSKCEHAFHVRLVGSLEKRVQHVQEIRQVNRKAALEFVHAEDRGRKRYLKKYFNKDINDPLLYHLLINTDLVSYGEAARIIGDAVLRLGR